MAAAFRARHRAQRVPGSAFARAAAPALDARVEAALLWSRTPPRQLHGFFPIRREHPYGPLRPRATSWTHAFAPLGTPRVDRDLADPVIDAFLTGLTSANPTAPHYVVAFPSRAWSGCGRRVRARRGCPNARFGGQNRAALAPGGERAGYLSRALSPKRCKEIARLGRRLAGHGRLERATARREAQMASMPCMPLRPGQALRCAGAKKLCSIPARYGRTGRHPHRQQDVVFCVVICYLLVF